MNSKEIKIKMKAELFVKKHGVGAKSQAEQILAFIPHVNIKERRFWEGVIGCLI